MSQDRSRTSSLTPVPMTPESIPLASRLTVQMGLAESASSQPKLDRSRSGRVDPGYVGRLSFPSVDCIWPRDHSKSGGYRRCRGR